MLTIIAGVLLTVPAMQAFFVGTAKTPLELVLFFGLVLAAFSVLPLGVVAIFRPRVAAHGIGLCWLVLMVVGYGSLPWRNTASWSLTDLLEPLLLYFPPTIGIVALLLYGAGPAPGDGISEGGAADAASTVQGRIARLANSLGLGERARQAQWGAIVLGILAGAWRLRTGASLFLRFAHAHDWFSVVGVGAATLVLLPFAVFGIWRPRLASYLLAASVVVALAFPMRGAHGLGDALAYLVWAAIPALPSALVAGLFMYASTGRSLAAQR